MNRLFCLFFALLFLGCQHIDIEETEVKDADEVLLTKGPYLYFPLDLIYNFKYSTLSQKAQEDLFNISGGVSFFEPFYEMMMQLYFREIKITFEIDPNANGLAYFRPWSHTICFREEKYAGEYQVVLEEFIHVFQYFFAPSANRQYHKNIEFEAKVIRDIMSRYYLNKK